MATVAPTISDISGDGLVRKIVWTPLTLVNTPGDAADWVKWADRSVAFTGTFDTATVVLQGSNDGTNWFTLSDPQGNAVSATAAKLEQVLEMTHWVRPYCSAVGATTSITVTLLMRKPG